MAHVTQDDVVRILTDYFHTHGDTLRAGQAPVLSFPAVVRRDGGLGTVALFPPEAEDRDGRLLVDPASEAEYTRFLDWVYVGVMSSWVLADCLPEALSVAPDAQSTLRRKTAWRATAMAQDSVPVPPTLEHLSELPEALRKGEPFLIPCHLSCATDCDWDADLRAKAVAQFGDVLINYRPTSSRAIIAAYCSYQDTEFRVHLVDNLRSAGAYWPTSPLGGAPRMVYLPALSVRREGRFVISEYMNDLLYLAINLLRTRYDAWQQLRDDPTAEGEALAFLPDSIPTAERRPRSLWMELFGMTPNPLPNNSILGESTAPILGPPNLYPDALPRRFSALLEQD